MNWAQITVKTTTEAADIIAGIFHDIGTGGAVIEDRADIALYQRPDDEWDLIDEHITDKMDPEVCVRGFVPEDERLSDQLAYVRSELLRFTSNAPELNWGSLTVSAEKVSDEDWANTWKKYYKPNKPGKYIVIKPSWEKYKKQKGDLVLEMDPGMAFGTGTHETTRLCIRLLEKYVTADTAVFDVGCGTGVLAMSAALLGARSVTAIDIDPVAVKVANHNIAINHLTDKINAFAGNLLEGQFAMADVIVANIIADIVIRLTPKAKEHLHAQGIFITSGIINERAQDVQDALSEEGFRLLEVLTEGEWTAIAAQRSE